MKDHFERGNLWISYKQILIFVFFCSFSYSKRFFLFMFNLFVCCSSLRRFYFLSQNVMLLLYLAQVINTYLFLVEFEIEGHIEHAL